MNMGCFIKLVTQRSHVTGGLTRALGLEEELVLKVHCLGKRLDGLQGHGVLAVQGRD